MNTTETMTTAKCSMTMNGDVVVMRGPSGTHTIGAGHDARIMAHWKGFCEVNGQAVSPETEKAVRIHGLARCFFALQAAATEWISPGRWGFTASKMREYEAARAAGRALAGL